MTFSSQPLWVRTVDELAQLAGIMAKAPWIALDTESDSMFRYRERICLIQINAGGQLALIDTLALEPDPTWPSRILAPLAPILENPAIPLWLHGGENDIGLLARDYVLRGRGVFDTQQAAAMLGRTQTGYGSLVLNELGIQLDKSWTTYDWATRPLAEGALAYALADVAHLPALVERMMAAVQEADLQEEVAIASAAVEECTVHAAGFDPAGFWRLKGVTELNPKQITVLCALWAWRDGVGKEANQPPGRIVNGELLLHLGRICPEGYGQLKAMGVTGRVLREYGEAIVNVVHQALQNPVEPPPRVRAREVEPVEELREEYLKEWRRVESERRNVPTQVVLPARALDHLKRYGFVNVESAPQLGPKRLATYGSALAEACRKGEADAANGVKPARRRHRR